MKFRAFEPGDVEWADRIHERYYKTQFDRPDFTRGYLCAYTVEHNDDVIAVGGVRPIAEAMLLTNPEVPTITRARMLLTVLELSKSLAASDGFRVLYAFIHDPVYRRALEEHGGFRRSKGTIMELEI